MKDYCTVPFLPANEEQTKKIAALLEKTNLI